MELIDILPFPTLKPQELECPEGRAGSWAHDLSRPLIKRTLCLIKSSVDSILKCIIILKEETLHLHLTLGLINYVDNCSY
jgi:hypothetical protein